MTPQSQAPQGWEPLDSLFSFGPRPRFLSGDSGADRLRVRYYARKTDQSLVAMVWFGPGSEGPPGHVHGGAISAVLDEAMGAAAWHAGHPVVAARIVINYLRMVPLGQEVLLETEVASAEGRKVKTRAFLADESGTRYADGEGLYIVLPPEQRPKLDATRLA